MQYQSSKGAVEISTMPLSYAKNALNKLSRTEPGRTAEIEALQAHVDKLTAEFEAAALAGGDDTNPRAVMGDNNPPAEEQVTIEPKWEAVQIHMDDLLVEAKNWADGVAIENQAQADAVASLRQRLQEATSLADDARKIEKAPIDLKVTEIQDRYNAYIAPMKNRKPGSVVKAAYALGNLLTPWLQKQEAEKLKRERLARAEADKATAAALEAHKEAAGSSDLGAIEEAAELMQHAEDAAAAARRVEREKVQAHGEVRAVSMRSYWRAEMIEGQGGAVVRHYIERHPDRFRAALKVLVDEDVAAGVRSIPGVNIIEDRKVA
ncbi:hypothetical protein [Novosphingobium resinovorum]|uniref:Uncharacterized protein n=1 Tax=Novosphingobium resinovorum TaxID=158500 RepID=A0A1D8A2L7_9SPHN|nr:hypothetical protein [Novosphingobium resinovorum]AOR76310.1 hypothetical protein BES08_05710 [Novosphingobium resinovorum]